MKRLLMLLATVALAALAVVVASSRQRVSADEPAAGEPPGAKQPPAPQWQFCYSCGSPLYAPDFKGLKPNYCKNCTDEQGNVKPKEEVRQGIAQWLKSWQPGLDDAKALQRATYYMKAMPHWAE